MKSNKSMRYIYVDYDFYREDKPLLREDMNEKEKVKIKKKIMDMKYEIEHTEMNLPEGCRGQFTLIPGYEGKEYVARMEITVFEQGFKDWEIFIKKMGGAEQFIKKVMDERRERLIEKIKEIKKEGEKNIDVRVLGKSGYHRVYSEEGKLKCDCKLFERTGECHHVELVKSMMRDGKVKEDTKEIEPPVILWKSEEGEIKYDKERHILSIPMEDKNPTLTVRMLHSYGYGLGVMREIGIVPKQFKLEQLMDIVHGAGYDEVMERASKGEDMGKVEMPQEMEMGA